VSRRIGRDSSRLLADVAREVHGEALGVAATTPLTLKTPEEL
jgi:hypothetical protein